MSAIGRSLSLIACVIALLAFASVHAQQPATPGNGKPPAGFVAPPPPKPEETNAERARSQPGNNAPFWRAVRDSGEQRGFTSLPGPEQGVLIQRFVDWPGSPFTTAGEAWRQVRNHWIVPYGAALVVITLVAIALFYWRKGPIGHTPAEGRGERRIERFTPFERAAHWTNAIAFVILAISGIVMAFGRHFLLPILGAQLFGWLTYALKTLHNVVGPLFVVSLVIVIVTFVRDELPQRGDWQWLRRGGGMLSGTELPSHRFNAGEKVVFWVGAVGLGLIVAVSGLYLDKVIPGLAYLRGDMQIAHMVHAIAAMLMMALFLGHIYLGTIGVRGVYRAMRYGYVDEAWAKEHHAWWYEDIKAGRIPARRSEAKPPPPQPEAEPVRGGAT